MFEVLSVLEEKEDYQRYKDLVMKHTDDPDIIRVAKWMGEYYTETGNDTIDWTAFGTFFLVKNPMIKDTKKTVFESMFSKLASPAASTLKSSLIKTYLERYHANKISFLAMEVAEGRKGDLSDIQIELDGYMDSSGRAAEMGKELGTATLKEIFSSPSYGTGLNWRLEALNDSLGPIRQGNFILFGGRPDSGKTSLLCSEATYMAMQLPPHQKVLYFTNEEGYNAVRPRMLSAALGVDHGTLQSDPDLHEADATSLFGGDKDKIMIIDKHDLSITDIEWWLNRVDAGLIMIDQLRKVKGFDDVKGVSRLEKLFNLGREWSKQYAPVITVTQLDGEADNEPYPSMARLYESKTAVQGEMDAIVNIGVVEGSVPANARYLNVVKNKLPTPRDPAMRKGRHEVTLFADIARFS